MNSLIDQLRRRLVLGIFSLPLSGIAAAAVTRSPSATEGPFYPTRAMRFKDVNNDLVRISSAVAAAGGEIVRVQGRLRDINGRSVPGARVEIWQCDVNGRYLHHGDAGRTARDPGFQGFGQDVTRDDGSFQFRTIKPVPYSGRTPHIHVKVWVAGEDRLTTQLYLTDHPDNKRDWLFRRLTVAQRNRVTMKFTGDGSEPVTQIDLVV